MINVRKILQRSHVGDVLLVHCDHSGISYILKTAPLSMKDDITRSEFFNMEVDVLQASLAKKHPNVMAPCEEKLQFQGLEDGVRFIALPYYAQGDLFEKIYVRGGMGDTIKTATLSKGIAQGLNHVHEELKYVHNDVALENILIKDDGDAVICDFGLARRLHTPWDPYRRLCGRKQYQAPEIHHNLSSLATQATDIFSLGVIIFVLITGTIPFQVPDATYDERFKIIEQRNVGYLCEELDVKVSPGTADLLSGMLAIDPVLRLTMPQVLDHEWMFV